MKLATKAFILTATIVVVRWAMYYGVVDFVGDQVQVILRSGVNDILSILRDHLP